MSVEMPELLTPEEVALRLSIPKETLAQWRMTKRELPFVKVGRLVRYRHSDIAAFINQNLHEVAVKAVAS